MRGTIRWAGGRRRFYLDGKEVTEAEFDLAFPPQKITGPFMGPAASGWPILSEALAVHPSQVAEAQESARARGVPTQFLPDGRAVLRDRDHRRRYLKAYGFFDRNGGYGDG